MDADRTFERAQGPALPPSALAGLHRRYAWFTLAMLGFIAAMALIERIGAPRSWIGTAFLVSTVGVYAGIGFFGRTTREIDYFVAGRRVPAIYNGMSTAADWMSAASFIGTAGVLYLQGFAGLAYILGWTGGYCLLALLLVPYLRRFGGYTVPDFLGARYGGHAPRLVGAGAAVLISFVYLVVQIYGVGLVAAHLTGFGFELGILIGLGGVLVCSFLGGMRAVTWTQVAQYVVLIVAYLVPLAILSVKQTGDWLPMAGYGELLARIAVHEQALTDDPRERDVIAAQQARAAQADRRLRDVPAAMQAEADALAARVASLRAQNAPLVLIHRAERDLAALPRSADEAARRYRQQRAEALDRARPLGGLPPQTLPHAAGDPEGDAAASAAYGHARRNFIALMLCLMLGTAAMPHVLVRFQTTPSVTQARRSVAWSLLFIVVLYLAAPWLAVLVKLEVLQQVVGQPMDHLPAWLSRWARLDPALVSIEDINGDGVLQLGELRLAGDLIVLAAPEIGGLAYFATCLVAAGGLAAALSTADGLLLTIANALSHDLYYQVLNPRAPALRRVLLSKLMVMLAALLAASVASARNTAILPLVSSAFSLAASAFFPALVAGIFWSRANRAGALAGMAVGLGVCGYYMATTTPALRQFFGVAWPLERCLWFGIDPEAAGVFAVPAGALSLVLASLATKPPASEQRALVERLRRPLAPGH